MTRNKVLVTVFVVIFFLLAFIVRIYRIENPIADWHSWRQADTAAVARNFYDERFNLLYPRGDDMSTVSSVGQPNLERYRFVEFPIYPAIVYLGYLINQGVDERIARLVAIAFSLGSIAFIYLIAKRFFGRLTAILAAFIMAFLPYSVFYSRTILPEASLVFFCLGMLYFVDRWIFQQGRSFYLAAVFFTACAFLTKPMAVFYLLPILYLIIQKEGKVFFNPKRYLLWLFPSLAPFVFWRVWMSQYPEGIPASGWLFNGGDEQGRGIRFRPAFWRWIIGDRLSREILSPAGFALFTLGGLLKPLLRESYAMHVLLLSSFLYLVIFARGNAQHDYYQVLISPVLIIFTARGISLLLQGLPFLLPRFITIPIGILMLFLIFILSINEIRGLYQINNPIVVDAGRKADQILPRDATVLASYNGDTALLYYVNRNGFPHVGLPIEELIKNYGITAMVSTAKDAKTSWAMNKYKVLADERGYIIIDLTSVNPEFKVPEPIF